MTRKSNSPALGALALLWLVTRLPLWLVAPGAEFDMDSYARVAATLGEGGRLYGDEALAGRYPYFPAWALLLWGLDSLAPHLGLSPQRLFKIPGMLADLGIAFLIFRIAQRLAPPSPALAGATDAWWTRRPFWAALAWCVSPVAILISAGHGQFDSVALGFVLLAAWYLEFSEHPRSDFASALSLGFAIAFKTWPVFFLPLFVRSLSRRREQYHFVLTALALPALLLLPFLASGGFDSIVKALSYSGSQAFSFPEALRGIFFGAGASPSSYRAAAGAWRDIGLASLGLAFAAYSLGPWRFPLFAGLSYATLTLYVFAPGMAAQYLCWLLPFSLLVPGRLALRYSLASLPLLLVFYGFFAPGAFLTGPAAKAPGPPGWFFPLWAFVNLGFWFFLIREWVLMGRLCRWPKGRTGLL